MQQKTRRSGSEERGRKAAETKNSRRIQVEETGRRGGKDRRWDCVHNKPGQQSPSWWDCCPRKESSEASVGNRSSSSETEIYAPCQQFLHERLRQFGSESKSGCQNLSTDATPITSSTTMNRGLQKDFGNSTGSSMRSISVASSAQMTSPSAGSTGHLTQFGMPSMPPLFRARGPPSEAGSDVGSAFGSEYNGPKLFVKPSQKTNRVIIINAINSVLAGNCERGHEEEVSRGERWFLDRVLN